MRPISELQPVCANVLGIAIAATNIDDAVRCAHQLLRRRGRGYICATGVHGIMEARRDQTLRRILNHSFLCIPDGMPTVWVGRLQAHRNMRRVYGPDFMLQLCRLSVTQGYRHFLYGGKEGVAQKLALRLQQMIPGIQIAGVYTPPFRRLNPDEQKEVVAVINQSGADIVWVGISTPKQEYFMAETIGRLNPCLMVGVGAAFDIHAGITKDAAPWIKTLGLQWLDRLAKEPRRMWKRYLRNNPQFLWEIGLQLSGLRKFEVTAP